MPSPSADAYRRMHVEPARPLSPLESGIRYRPEIDGLRAVAVLAAALFHAQLGVPGGYVGVDVFFVISGFLITSLIWRDLPHDRFSLARFWERRARRILPALLVVSLVTLAAGWFLLLPDDYAELGRSLAAQALFGANLHFSGSTDYFARAAEQQPFLHTWSLAVEEQFYLVLPLLLLGLVWLAPLRRAAVVVGSVLLVLAGSLAWSIHGVAHDPSAAFYLLPGRAWELLVGSVLALLPAARLTLNRVPREILSVAGMALVLVPAFAYRKTTAFPGLAAVPPCLGAALIIWSNAPARTAVGKALSVRPIVFVGLVSYSFYLWHWPLLAFSHYWALEPPSIAHRVVLLAAALVLATLSWRFVETPFRQRRVFARPRSFWTLGGAAVAATFAAGVAVALTGGFPERLPPQALLYADAKHDRAFLRDLTLEDVREGRLVPFGATTPGARAEMLVWGDSHAMAALPAFDALFKERGLAGLAATHVATAPVLGFVRESKRFGLGRAAPAFAEAVVAYAREKRIPDVVLIANWGGYLDDHAGDRSAELAEAVVATIERLAGAGVRPWIVLQIPTQEFDVPKALALAAAHGGDPSDFGATAVESSGLIDVDRALLSRVAAAGGRIIDPRPRFLDATGRRYVVSSNGATLYTDSHHLSTKGAQEMLLPLLRETFALRDARAPH